MHPRYEAILFDLDGTLIDTNHLIVTCFQHTFQSILGLDVPAEQITPHFGEPLTTTMEFFAPGRGAELTAFYRKINIAWHDDLIRQFAGVKEAVDELHRSGVKLAIVTSKLTETALRGMRVCGLDGYFDVVVGMDQVVRHKPDPEPALVALERLGVTPGPHVLMVGDSKFDILCGHNAGLEAAAVAWSTQDRDELEAASHPDHWLQTPADLLRLAMGEQAS